MIEIENIVPCSDEQLKFAVEAMRNPMNSWGKSDSKYNSTCEFVLGPNDRALMLKLAKAGTEHRTFMRMMPIGMRVTAPLYWWKEMDRYTVGKAQVSCSTMHKIADQHFTPMDFSHEHLLDDYTDCSPAFTDDAGDDWYSTDILMTTIRALNEYRAKYLSAATDKDKKEYWWQLIQLLPSTYNQTRNLYFNYEVLRKIYHERRNHKLDEWQDFCDVLETLPYRELITCD